MIDLNQALYPSSESSKLALDLLDKMRKKYREDHQIISLVMDIVVTQDRRLHEAENKIPKVARLLDPNYP